MWGYVSLPKGPKIKKPRQETVAPPLEPIPEDEAAPLTSNPGKTSGNGRSSYNKYDEGNKAKIKILKYQFKHSEAKSSLKLPRANALLTLYSYAR